MTFLDKYAILKKSIPVPALTSDSYTVDCEYSDYSYKSKNCYYCYNSNELLDSIYTIMGWGNKLIDCDFVTESEKCYQCVDCTKSYNSTYLIDSNSSSDCHFSAFLNSCSDCFGCVGLKNKKYCILNNQLTKDQYEKAVREIKKELEWR